MDMNCSEIQALLDEFKLSGTRTVSKIFATIVAGQEVAWQFYFGPCGLEGPTPEVIKRYEYINNMFRKQPRWWIEQCATCGAPDETFLGQEVRLYGKTYAEIDFFVRSGTPYAPEFIKEMAEDDLNEVGLRDTIQTQPLFSWLSDKTLEYHDFMEKKHSSGAEKCSAPNCFQVGKLRCSKCRAQRYCGVECQRSHWKEHKTWCEALQR